MRRRKEKQKQQKQELADLCPQVADLRRAQSSGSSAARVADPPKVRKFKAAVVEESPASSEELREVALAGARAEVMEALKLNAVDNDTIDCRGEEWYEQVANAPGITLDVIKAICRTNKNSTSGANKKVLVQRMEQWALNQ